MNECAHEWTTLMEYGNQVCRKCDILKETALQRQIDQERQQREAAERELGRVKADVIHHQMVAINEEIAHEGDIGCWQQERAALAPQVAVLVQALEEAEDTFADIGDHEPLCAYYSDASRELSIANRPCTCRFLGTLGRIGTIRANAPAAATALLARVEKLERVKAAASKLLEDGYYLFDSSFMSHESFVANKDDKKELKAALDALEGA